MHYFREIRLGCETVKVRAASALHYAREIEGSALHQTSSYDKAVLQHHLALPAIRAGFGRHMELVQGLILV